MLGAFASRDSSQCNITGLLSLSLFCRSCCTTPQGGSTECTLELTGNALYALEVRVRYVFGSHKRVLIKRVTVNRAHRSKGADDQRVSCSKYDPNAEGITVVGSASHMTPLTAEFNAQFNNPNLTQIGSSLKFLLVRAMPQCFP